MPSNLFDQITPRADVLTGVLSDAVFAASLEDVVAGRAPAAYGDAEAFFASTYPSSGLRSLLDEAIGRLGGSHPDGAPIIRLETNLGGGKTHNLIALYHAALGRLSPMRALEFMDSSRLPAQPVARVGVFVGTEAGASALSAIDGITPNTLWGQLALQLGGAAGYEVVRDDDLGRTAPGAEQVRRLLGESPCLILLDELARYLAVAQGYIVGGGTLATQTTAFLMALFEAVASHERAVVVVTTTGVTDAFGDQTTLVLDALAQLQSLVARREHVLRPSDEADLPKILARRLFETSSGEAASAVAARYAEAARSAIDRGADLPEVMGSPSFAQSVEGSWPFHPDLVDVLDKRLSTIPNFQRTRGALRLLARTVRLLWEAQPPNTELIHLHHIDLADKDTANDLSSRLDKASFEPVIRADIASQAGGDPSHAEQVDARMGTAAPYARRLATSAYLYSLIRDLPGVPSSTLIGSVLAPDDDPNVVIKALDNLEGAAWYLHTDARGYRFGTEASLVKLTQEAESQIAPSRVRQEATDILGRQFKDSALKVRRTWDSNSVPDRSDDASLVIIHWDEFGDAHGLADLHGSAPSVVTELWEKTPAGGVREFRNRLVFLLPSAAHHDSMLRTVRRHLALRSLAASPETLQALPEEKRRELSALAGASELEARIAVCNHMNLLVVPQADGLELFELDVVTQASMLPNQTDAVLHRLAAMEKTLASGDPALDPGWIRSKLGDLATRPLATQELLRVFARRPDLKLVLDTAQVRDLIVAGIRRGVWEYEDPERAGPDGWATAERTVPVRMAEETLLHPPGSAPEPEPIPVIAPPPPRPRPDNAPPGGFDGRGNAGVAVQQARQSAADAEQRAVVALSISVDVTGSQTSGELARLLAVVPEGAQGASLGYVLKIVAQLGGPAEVLELSFTGTPKQYDPLKSGVDHVLRQHEAHLEANVRATFERPLDLSGDEVERIRQRAVDVGPSSCTVSLETEVV